MNNRVYGALIYFCLHFFQLCDNIKEDRYSMRRGFLVYRTVSITQKSCVCTMPYSCSCCQNVVILYTKAEKSLCVNFTYQRNGLNVDVSLNSDTIKVRTITVFKPFKFCIVVPGCLFSSACINVLELNQFPRSITVCLRLDIHSKKLLWQLNYDCVSISTELPTMPTNATTRTIDSTIGSSVEMSEMTTEGILEETSQTDTITVTVVSEMTMPDMVSMDETTLIDVTMIPASDTTTEQTEMTDTATEQMEETSSEVMASETTEGVTDIEPTGTTNTPTEGVANVDNGEMVVDMTTVSMSDATTVQMSDPTDETM